MSLVPLLFSDWWEDLERPHHLLDQDFGLGMHPEQLLVAAHPRHPRRIESYLQPTPMLSKSRCPAFNYIRPWAELTRAAGDRGGVSTVEADKNKFQVTLDVQQFKPEEISVTVKDRYVLVHAKHEEKQDDHGWISREFTRKYLIPEQCDIEQVASTLSSDGVLSIQAPRKEQPKPNNEKSIKIEHTGKPAIRESSEKKIEKEAEDKK